MKKELFTALYIIAITLLGLLWAILPQHASDWVIRIAGITFIIQGITEFIPLYKKYKGRKVAKKFMDQ